MARKCIISSVFCFHFLGVIAERSGGVYFFLFIKAPANVVEGSMEFLLVLFRKANTSRCVIRKKQCNLITYALRYFRGATDKLIINVMHCTAIKMRFLCSDCVRQIFRSSLHFFDPTNERTQH